MPTAYLSLLYIYLSSFKPHLEFKKRSHILRSLGLSLSLSLWSQTLRVSYSNTLRFSFCTTQMDVRAVCIVCCHCDCLIGRVMWYEWLFFVGVGVQEEPCSSFWELGLQRWFAIHAVLWVSEAGWVASIQLFWGSWFVCGWWLVPEWCDDSGHDCRASSNGTFLWFSNSKILFFFWAGFF